VGRDWTAALLWYERAASQGHVAAMTCIGALYKI
jgi:TPR repeat protein